MKRLSFVQMLAELEKVLFRRNFVRVGGEVFIGDKAAAISPWISLVGNDFSFSPVLGVCSKRIDKIVGKALKKGVSNFVTGKFAVPLFRITPERISPGDQRIIRLRTGEPGYSGNEVAAFAEWLEQIGCVFLLQHSTFAAALDVALKWNKNDQAQQYYIPALMLLLGKQSEKDAYVQEVIGGYQPEAGEIASVYRQFIQELDDAAVANRRDE